MLGGADLHRGTRSGTGPLKSRPETGHALLKGSDTGMTKMYLPRDEKKVRHL